MKTFLRNSTRVAAMALLALSFITAKQATAQLTSGTTYTIDNTVTGAANLFPNTTTFNSFNTAVTALNATTAGSINSNVIFNVKTGQTFNESPLKITYLNTNGSNPTITFQRSGVGANPLVQGTNGAGAGDTILLFKGGDYYVLDGIDFKDNPSNTTANAQMEVGLGFGGPSTNGCRNNTVKNCTVTLNKTNSNYTTCVGLYSSATSATGTNDNNSFINNTVQNALAGYDLAGHGPSSPISDSGNKIDRVAPGRSLITNIGTSNTNHAIGQYVGVNVSYQTNLTIAHTTISNLTYYGTNGLNGSLYGINVDGATASDVVSFNNDTLQNFIVSVGSTDATYVRGFNLNDVGATTDIHDNILTGLSTVNAGGYIYGVWDFPVGNTGNKINVYNNYFSNFTCPPAGDFNAVGVLQNSADFSVYNNTFRNFSGGTSTSEGAVGMRIVAPIGAALSQFHDNKFSNFSSVGGAVYGLMCSSVGFSPILPPFYNNVIDSFKSAATVAGLSITVSGAAATVYNNRISNVSSTSVSALGTPVTGLILGSPGTGSHLVYNNMIYDLRADAAKTRTNGGSVKGISLPGVTSAGGSVKLYHNTVYLNGTATDADQTSSAIFISSTPTTVADAYDIQNNIFFNNYNVVSGNLAVAVWYRDSTSFNALTATSNNNLVYAGTPSAKNLLLTTLKNSAQTLGTPTTAGTYKYLVSNGGSNAKESNALSADPQFLSSTTPINVHIQATSPASGTAITVATVTTDIDGNTRPGGAGPDIGADEIGSGCVPPSAGNVTAPQDTVCNGTPASLVLLGSTGGSPIQWQESPNGTSFIDIPGATNASYSTNPLTQTTYYRAVVGSGGCTDTAAVFAIHVPPAITASFVFTSTGKTVSFVGTAPGSIILYSWDFGDGNTGSGSTTTHTYAIGDTIYNVCLTVYDGSNCSFTFCKDVLVGTVGINSLVNSGIKIYPNLVNDYVTIENRSGSPLSKIDIYDVAGHLVLSPSSGVMNENLVSLDVSSLTKGVYYLKVTSDKSSFVQKLIKL